MQAAMEQCPWCGSEISRAKFDEIAEKIRKEEQTKLSAIRRDLETRHRFEIEQEKKKAAQAGREAGQAAIKELSEKLAKLQAEEAHARKKLKEEADKELKKKLDEQRQLFERSNDQN